MYVTKASGIVEPFSEFKLTRSLKRAGAGPQTAAQIVHEIRRSLIDGSKTSTIHDRALSLLEAKKEPVAARYNLKHALALLGPTGYPFELFIGAVFESLGYQVQTRQILVGKCTTHEVDVVGRRGKEHIMVEAKFHNSQGFKTDVKVALYVKARFEDIIAGPTRKPHLHKAWLVTNTKFTSQAIEFAECAGLQLLGWGYPASHNLQQIVEGGGLVPITALSGLTRNQTHALLTSGLVLCSELKSKPHALHHLGVSKTQSKFVLEELDYICEKKPQSL